MHPLLEFLARAYPDLTLDARLKVFAPLVEGKKGKASTTGGYLYQIVRGYRHPSRRLARRIEEVTGGKVSRGVLLAWEPPPGKGGRQPLRAAS